MPKRKTPDTADPTMHRTVNAPPRGYPEGGENIEKG